MNTGGAELIMLGGTHSVGGFRQDWAQVYSTVHVSPVWLRDWRRGPVGVTTEAGVCEGWEEGKKGVGEEKGETKEEGEEEKDKGGRWGKGRPSFRVGLLSSKWPHCPTSPFCAAPSLGPCLRRLPPVMGVAWTCCQKIGSSHLNKTPPL